MAYFTTVKGRTHTNIHDAKTGEYLCQLRNKEVRAWLLRAERAAHEEETFWGPHRRAARLETVKAYLAKRAARPKAVQLELFK